MSLRTERMAEALREELMDIILRDLKDPAIGIVSITHVRVSTDLKHAWIGITVLGDETDHDETLNALQKATGHIRRELAARIKMRLVPEVVFEIDKATEHSVRISQILHELGETKNGDGDV